MYRAKIYELLRAAYPAGMTVEELCIKIADPGRNWMNCYAGIHAALKNMNGIRRQADKGVATRRYRYFLDVHVENYDI